MTDRRTDKRSSPFRSVSRVAERVKGKGKVRRRRGRRGPEGEKSYSSNLSLTSALDGVGG
jgi:hypothetical protein